MKNRLYILIISLCFCCSHRAFCQADHYQPTKDSTLAYKINVPRYFVLLATSFKREYTAPFHLRKRDWLHAGIFALTATAVSFADEPVQKAALQLRSHHPQLINTGSFISKFGDKYEIAGLTALSLYTFISKNEKLKTTTLLATQAALTAGITSSVIKFITFRQRPNYYGSEAIEAEPYFHGPFPGPNVPGKRSNSSFPSGHTTAAFAAATVFAKQYRDKPIIPVLMYCYASAIGISRITENKHWTTDVLAGAALGYVTALQVIHNYEQHAKAFNKKTNGQVNVSLSYGNRQVKPGIIYTFR